MKKVLRIMEQMDGLRKDWGLNIRLKKETDRASNYNQLSLAKSCLGTAVF